MIECEPRDIRYVATEFDGWNERHWSLPFEGAHHSYSVPDCVLYGCVYVCLCASGLFIHLGRPIALKGH